MATDNWINPHTRIEQESMLIGSALPPLITRIAQRVGSLGLAALLGPDFAARLDG